MFLMKRHNIREAKNKQQSLANKEKHVSCPKDDCMKKSELPMFESRRPCRSKEPCMHVWNIIIFAKYAIRDFG
jgi:hypothetical protein